MPVRLHRGTAGAQLCRASGSDRAALFPGPAHRGDQCQQWSGHHDGGLPFGKPAVSVAGELKPPAAKQARPRPRRFLANVRDWFALLGRAPRAAIVRPAWRPPVRLALASLLPLGIIAGTMVLLDAPMIIAVVSLPEWVIRLFFELTDYGTSEWFLVPIALVLVTIAALASPALSHLSQLVLVALPVRPGFVFAASALPGLFVTIVKRLIGRARPFIGGDADPFR